MGLSPFVAELVDGSSPVEHVSDSVLRGLGSVPAGARAPRVGEDYKHGCSNSNSTSVSKPGPAEATHLVHYAGGQQDVEVGGRGARGCGAREYREGEGQGEGGARAGSPAVERLERIARSGADEGRTRTTTTRNGSLHVRVQRPTGWPCVAAVPSP